LIDFILKLFKREKQKKRNYFNILTL